MTIYLHTLSVMIVVDTQWCHLFAYSELRMHAASDTALTAVRPGGHARQGGNQPGTGSDKQQQQQQRLPDVLHVSLFMLSL